MRSRTPKSSAASNLEANTLANCTATRAPSADSDEEDAEEEEEEDDVVAACGLVCESPEEDDEEARHSVVISCSTATHTRCHGCRDSAEEV